MVGYDYEWCVFVGVEGLCYWYLVVWFEWVLFECGWFIDWGDL